MITTTQRCVYHEDGPEGTRCGPSNRGAAPAKLGFDAYCGSGEDYRCPLVMALALMG